MIALNISIHDVDVLIENVDSMLAHVCMIGVELCR